jgi:hypothetical protein
MNLVTDPKRGGRMKGIRTSIFLLSTLLSTAVYSYTVSPELSITPGKLCDRPFEYRYPSQVAYCKRDVTYDTKKIVFTEYGIDMESADFVRADYKIDHLIPLCVGGSNDPVNLWPQHKSSYDKTDLLEAELCKQMAKGNLSQAEAVDLVIEAKTHLERADQILRYVMRLK